jgi:hypothetical protein
MGHALTWQAHSKRIAMLAAGLLGSGCTLRDAEDESTRPSQGVDAATESSFDASNPDTRETEAVSPIDATATSGLLPGAPPRCIELQQLAEDVLQRRALVCSVDADCTFSRVDHTCLIPLVCGFVAATTELDRVSRELGELSAESEQACQIMEGQSTRSWCAIADCLHNGTRCDPETKRCVLAHVPSPSLPAK